MNPLDREEYAELLNIMDKTMPWHTESTLRMPHTYGPLPKNLMEESTEVNNKFLNNNQHIFEEMEYRSPYNHISTSHAQYHSRWFGDREILKHDGFFHKIGKTSHRGILPFAGMVLGFGSPASAKVLGATLTSGDTSSNTNVSTGSAYAQKTDSNGTIGQFYDQVALDCITASGNYHIGAYDDSGSTTPSGLTADTGSIAITANFAAKSVTEWSLGTAIQWCAYQQDNTTAVFNNKIVSGLSFLITHTYGALPNPYGSGSGNTRQYHQSLSHS